METVELGCEIRQTRPKGLVNRIRREGKIPAVIYGNNSATTAVAVGGADLKARVSGASRQRILRLKSASSELNDKHVILKEVQKTPVSGRILHADFYEVDLNKSLRVAVPLRFVGRAAGIADGGILSPLEREVEVECLPLEIPEAIDVDVTPLKIHDVLHIAALTFAGNVRPIFDTDFPVVTVLPPTVAEAPVAAAAPVEGAVAEGAAAAAPAAGEKAGEKTAEAAPAKETGGKKG